jgi:hypothetical protein
MKSLLPVRVLFAVAALYEGLLGLAFIVAAPQIFQLTAITPPNHWGYVHFAAGILVIFGYMFLQIALRPMENRVLIPYGILLKVCYVTTVVWHTYHGDIPPMWKWFAGADALFAVLFLWAMVMIEAASPRESAAPAPPT